MSIMQTVLQSPHFMVIAHVCRKPRVDCGYVQGDEPARFIFTRRGSFAVHVGGRTCFARPGTAVLVRRDVEYRISHPDLDSCDCCTDVWVDETVLDQLGLAGQPPCREIRHDLAFQQAHLELLHGLRSGAEGAAEPEEVLLDALGCLLRDSVAVRSRPSVAAWRLACVEEAMLAPLATTWAWASWLRWPAARRFICAGASARAPASRYASSGCSCAWPMPWGGWPMARPISPRWPATWASAATAT